MSQEWRSVLLRIKNETERGNFLSVFIRLLANFTFSQKQNLNFCTMSVLVLDAIQ